MTDITQLLNNAHHGNPRAAEELLPLVYEELRKLAEQRLAREAPGQTLQPTALVHEAYLRLVPSSATSSEPDGELRWDSRGHFFAAAAEAMRRILIDKARQRRRAKHGGGRRRVDLDALSVELSPAEELLALDEALVKLEHADPRKASLVKLRFFAGLTMEECAKALGISLATAERDWTFARTWLYAELKDGE